MAMIQNFRTAVTAGAIGAGTLLLVTPQELEAALIRMDGTATVSESTAGFASDIPVGSIITFSITYDTSVPDSNPNVRNGSYFNSVTAANFNINNADLIIEKGTSTGDVFITNGNLFDSFGTQINAPSVSVGNMPLIIDGIGPIFDITGTNPTALFDDSLENALSEQSLSAFADRYIYLFSNASSGNDVVAPINQFTLTVVPAPATLALLAGTGLLAIRRRRTIDQSLEI